MACIFCVFAPLSSICSLAVSDYILFPPPTVLLEAIMKNGSAAGNGAYCRKPTSGGDQSKPNNMKDSTASAAGDSGKAYTKDQVEGVQRYCFK